MPLEFEDDGSQVDASVYPLVQVLSAVLRRVESGLTAIALNADLLATPRAVAGGGAGPVDARTDRARAIARATERIGRDLALLERTLPSTSSHRPVSRRANPTELCRDVARLLGPFARSRNVALSTSTSGEVREALGAPHRLRHALVALALLALSREKRGGAVEIVVCLDEAARVRLSLRSQTRRGWPDAPEPGLSAALAVAIIEEEGGAVAVAEAPGELFGIVLPAASDGEGTGPEAVLSRLLPRTG